MDNESSILVEWVTGGAAAIKVEAVAVPPTVLLFSERWCGTGFGIKVEAIAVQPNILLFSERRHETVVGQIFIKTLTRYLFHYLLGM